MRHGLKYLDLSGFMFTGKHAVSELIRELNGYYVPHFEFEFALLRIQDGIRDLENALVYDWSPIRSDAAIRRFKQLTISLSSQLSIFNVRDWFRVGLHYNKRYGGNFRKLSKQYIEELIDIKWRGDWPFAMFNFTPFELFIRRVKDKLGFSNAFDVDIALASGSSFIPKTRNYLNNVLSSGVPDWTRCVVMQNAIEPFNPQRALYYFDNAKAIIIDRDPRDNYVTAVCHSKKFRKIAGAENPINFIKRYKILREIAKRNRIESDNVLKINFEDLVLKYDETVKLILRFLGEDDSIHLNKKQYFDPSVSIKNVRIYENYPQKEEIKLIEKELKEYCYQF